MLDDKEKKAVANAILVLQHVAMAHPHATDHDREMYKLADDARSELVPLLQVK